LRSVTYQNTSDDPSDLTRTLVIVINDGNADSNKQFREIEFIAVNDPPALSGIEPLPAAYVENDLPISVTDELLIADSDNTIVQAATIAITNNFDTGNDVLIFSDQAGISGAFDTATGILTLSGTSSIANYQTVHWNFH